MTQSSMESEALPIPNTNQTANNTLHGSAHVGDDTGPGGPRRELESGVNISNMVDASLS